MSLETLTRPDQLQELSADVVSALETNKETHNTGDVKQSTYTTSEQTLNTPNYVLRNQVVRFEVAREMPQPLDKDGNPQEDKLVGFPEAEQFVSVELAQAPEHVAETDEHVRSVGYEIEISSFGMKAFKKISTFRGSRIHYTALPMDSAEHLAEVADAFNAATQEAQVR